MRTFLKGVLYVVVFGYLIAAVVAFLFQRSLLYFPSHVDQGGAGTTIFKPLANAAGEFVGYVRPAEGASRRVAILFHGNAGEAIDRVWFAQLIPYPDVTLILAEYPGYGARQGSPSEDANVQAARDLVRLARERWKVPVTLVGESLGTGVASSAAREEGVDRLALISPYKSIQELAQAMLPWLPMDLLLRDRYKVVRIPQGRDAAALRDPRRPGQPGAFRIRQSVVQGVRRFDQEPAAAGRRVAQRHRSSSPQ